VNARADEAPGAVCSSMQSCNHLVMGGRESRPPPPMTERTLTART
jgi:hypothetical protein